MPFCLAVVSAFFGFLHFSLERLRPQAPPPSEIIGGDKEQCEDSTEATSVEAKVELKADPIVVEAVIDQSGREANAQPGVIVDALCNKDTFVGPGISIGVNEFAGRNFSGCVEFSFAAPASPQA
ncbi:unnamed protein product [Calypogeia fissa]